MSSRAPRFPGMDPWLEHPALWPDVHDSLISAIRDALAPKVDPRHYVGVESRVAAIQVDDAPPRSCRPDVSVVLVDPSAEQPEGGVAVEVETEVEVLEVVLPSVEEVEETYLTIHEVGTNRLVTAIEILSPSNKSPGQGRQAYLKKRDDLLATRTNLVELDLLRAGEPMPSGRPDAAARDYRILISTGSTRPRATLAVFRLRAPLPTIRIPLLPGDDPPRLELNRILHDLIDRARYFRRLDYTQPPLPPLRPEDAEWAARIIAAAPVL